MACVVLSLLCGNIHSRVIHSERAMRENDVERQGESGPQKRSIVDGGKISGAPEKMMLYKRDVNVPVHGPVGHVKINEA